MDMEYEEAKVKAKTAEAEYMASKNVLDEYKKRMDAAKKIIVELSSKGMEFSLLKVTHVERKGNVDMKVLQRKFDLMDGDIDACRKDKIISTRITTKQHGCRPQAVSPSLPKQK